MPIAVVRHLAEPALEARHPLGIKARLALDLALYTGARISDWAYFGPPNIRTQPDGSELLVYTEQKGRRRAVKSHELPVLPALRASIDATPVGHLVYLTTPEGKPYNLKSLGQWFVDRCKEAGLPKGLSVHGLRKCAAIRAAEGGATEHQLMALFGLDDQQGGGQLYPPG